MRSILSGFGLLSVHYGAVHDGSWYAWDSLRPETEDIPIHCVVGKMFVLQLVLPTDEPAAYAWQTSAWPGAMPYGRVRVMKSNKATTRV